MPLDPDRPIGSDLPCHHCGHNLRGLARTTRCPECGDHVLKSILALQECHLRLGENQAITSGG